MIEKFIDKLDFRKEEIGKGFTKYIVDGLPFPCAFHHFTEVDTGDPHDHPWDFTSHVLYGGYLEEVYQRTDDGLYMATKIFRKPNTAHQVPAEYVHRLIELPEGECITLVMTEPVRRHFKFWRFTEEGIFSKQWNEEEFTKL